jgi:hypothetical protein
MVTENSTSSSASRRQEKYAEPEVAKEGAKLEAWQILEFLAATLDSLVFVGH